MLKWTFDKTSVADGLNDAGILHFKDSTIGSLTRESIQNSLDARDKTNSDPVRVKFKLHHIHPEDVPGLLDLSGRFERGRDYVESASNVNQTFVKYYREALSDLKQDTIPVLEVSDYNTRGLDGDTDVVGSAFYNLIISDGETSGDTSRGGSFGVGKSALFNASKIRNILFSSLSEESGHKFIGRVKMSSFFDEDGERRRGEGIFGVDKGGALSSIEHIPDRFRRDQNGLSVFITDFRKPDGWEEGIKRRVLIDFWLAVIEEKLVVEINDNIVINRDNVEKLIKDTFSPELPDSSTYAVRSESPLPGVMAYLKGEKYEDTLEKTGNCRLYLTNNQTFAPIISHFRKPRMLIYKRAYRSATSVQGVFICDDDLGNEILRASENPEHLEWKTKNVDENSVISKRDVREALKEIEGYINEKIDLLTGYGGEDSIDMDLDWDLNDFGQSDGEGVSEIDPRGATESEEEYEVNKEKVRLTEVKEPPKVVLPVVITGSGGGKSKGSGRKSSKGVPGENQGEVTTELNYRAFCPAGQDNYHVVIIKDKINRNLTLEFRGATDVGEIKLNVVDVQGAGASLNGERVNLDLSKYNSSFKVLFDDDVKYSIIIRAFERGRGKQ